MCKPLKPPASFKLKNRMKKYTLEYFIKKFSEIPDSQWATKKFVIGDRKCAFGHCGAIQSAQDTNESKALMKLLSTLGTMDLFDVNDGKKPYAHLGSTPKERVINYLKSL